MTEQAVFSLKVRYSPRRFHLPRGRPPKLTPEDIEQIKNSRLLTNVELATLYGVTEARISQLRAHVQNVISPHQRNQRLELFK